MSEPTTQFVVLHTPGPNWQHGTDYRQQPGAMAHAQYYAQLHEQGKLAMGGPFMAQDRGGMMVTTADITLEEIEAFAAADPAVQNGLLEYEVLPWRVVMRAR
ncbi:MAG: YciI family protein [Anaerolineae bacterium]|nr:YciI family protein [Anaerolineae bacterium]